MNSPNEFNPHSANAMFATLLERFDQQSRRIEERHRENVALLGSLGAEVSRNSTRITALELARKYQLGWIAGATFVGGGIATVVSKFL